MNTVLIIVTQPEVALVVVVLAGYLIDIDATLRRISSTLGLVTFGVRAIDKQTHPIGPVVLEINGALEQVAGALEQVATQTAGGAPPATPAAGGEATHPA